MNILSLLTPKENTFYLDTHSTIRQALEKYDYHKFTVVPLIDKEGHYVESVSEGDILRFIKNNKNFNLQQAEDILLCEIEKYRSYKALQVSCSMVDVFILSLDQNFIPMIDDRGMFIGIIKRKDIIGYFIDRYPVKKK
ncbi:MAG TPA: CBS domain-containing protein [Candidatus Pelethenecus sp.]|jgi:CBS-domain-containing membrane protein|nr:CBS domain-containing protein [Candidatus Pelethenecus sp.]